MPSRGQSPLFYRRVFLGAGLILLLLVSAVSLSARQEHVRQPPPEESAAQPVQQARATQPVPSCLTPLRASDSTSFLAEARTLIPAIPERVLPGSLSAAPPLPPGLVPPPDPDGFNSLYGYNGPYYNTSDLDGTVAVLSQSLYSWPTATWKVSGMVRNQTRCPVHIASLSARLLGAHGVLLATATTSILVDSLRPGEPGPFMIEAPVASQAVHSVDWHVDFAEANGGEKTFEFEVYFEQPGPNTYVLDGNIHNSGPAIARNARVVVAWLDFQGNGRVLYSTFANLRLYSNPSMNLDAVDLRSGGDLEFVFSTTDPALVHTLSRGRYVLWGIGQ